VASVGFVGLGVMGGGIAARLNAAGHDVVGYNRTREKARWLEDRGVRLLDTPRAVAESGDVVFSMVTNTRALAAVAEGPEGIISGLRPGKVYVDMTTCSPEASRELAAKVAESGAWMLDAPVSGSVSTLERGKLSIMVGGNEEAFHTVEPILLDIGPTVRRVGENGQAVLMKIAINLSLQVQMVAFSEGLLLAVKSGIDPAVALETMLKSVIASPMLGYRAPFILDPPEEAWFDVNMMQKDMNLALEAGRRLDVSMPTTAAANEILTAARAMGLAEHDFAISYEVLARMAGLEKAAGR
jgi:3-hydroxyisobutyrate dehydrogenase-like beta-hydroxyacid dehydrogenase